MSRIITLTLLASAAVTPALAADEQTPIIVTATGAEQQADETGQAVTVLTREDIDRTQTVAISDLLQTTPGITVSRNGGVGTVTAVRIRGAEGDQTLVLIDGVRMGDPSAPGGGYDFGNLLAGNIDRIEVVRSPNSVPWGSQALGGVVNIVTALPEEGLSGRAGAEYGRYDSFSGNARLSFRDGRFSGAIGGHYYRTDGVSAARAGTEADGYRQYGVNARLGIAIVEAVDIDLRGSFADSRVDLDGFLSVPPYTPADSDEYSDTRQTTGYAGINARLFDGRFRNRIAFTIADINRDNYNPAFGTAPGFTARGRTERFEYQGDFAFSEQFRAVFGAETETSRLFTDDGFSAQDSKTGIDSVYGQLIVKPIPILALTGGVRHDDHDDFGSETTFGANAALALASGTTLRANYGEGFKAPTLFQLYSDYGNAALQPERARSYDVGIEQSLLDGAIVAGVTLFRRNTRNQIDYVSCFGSTDPICTGRPYGTYDNIARARTSGLEFELAVRPVEALDVRASYSHIDAENRSPGSFDFGKNLARRPRHTVNLSADYAPVEGLSVGASVLHVGDSFDNAANTVRLESYVLTGLRASYTVNERFTLYGRVDNLFGVNYQTAAHYGTPGRAAYVGVRAGF